MKQKFVIQVRVGYEGAKEWLQKPTWVQSEQDDDELVDTVLDDLSILLEEIRGNN